MSHVVHKYTINFSSETCSSHSQHCLTSCDLSVKWVETKHLIYGSRPKHLCCRRGNRETAWVWHVADSRLKLDISVNAAHFVMLTTFLMQAILVNYIHSFINFGGNWIIQVNFILEWNRRQIMSQTIFSVLNSFLQCTNVLAECQRGPRSGAVADAGQCSSWSLA